MCVWARARGSGLCMCVPQGYVCVCAPGLCMCVCGLGLGLCMCVCPRAMYALGLCMP